ncbi:TetR/AcrR family transcriptional regulator, partial [Ramlibacter sp. 2FC]|uniref:TetR/AcrR family transcriptional regulator n=1 Tax=Ramlibacter sp. 2FC TaxID=2502188 RepID=UPI0010F88284
APPRRTRRKEARPGELLEAALDLFVEKGFAATRSEEVAARAGVSKGTLFLYFPTKEELFKAVVRENIAGRVLEGANEAAGFSGPTGELLAHLMQQWWARFGATKASGIAKLIMSEASNFPELARFYQDEVVTPCQELVGSVLQRGMDRGEFRALDLPHAIYTVMAPLIFLVMWKHSMGPCCPPANAIEPEKFIAQHADVIVRGMLRQGQSAR